MTAIEWTGRTWNPTTGCDRISPGCDHCYALTMAGRLKLMGSAKYQNDGDARTSGPGFSLTVHPNALDLPLSVKKPTTWFVNSMSDLFHEAVPDSFIQQVWATMAATPQHTYQVLTKRARRLPRMTRDLDGGGVRLPTLANVWIGTSVESDAYTFRARQLRETVAAVRFLSCEPLLGPLPSLDLTGIGWVIVGAESGRGARPMDEGWVRELRDRTKAAGAAFFYKQRAVNGRKVSLPELDGSVWAEMPS